MGIFDFLKRKPTLESDWEAWQRALTNPPYRMGAFRMGITGTEQQPTAAQLLTDGFASVQAIASRAIANRVSDLEFRIQERMPMDGGGFEWADNEDHALKTTLDRPNPLLSKRQLLKLTSYWLTLSGEAFWLIVTNGAGATRELWPMSPRNVEKLASDGMPVSGFVFHGEAGETRYSLEEVVWMFDPDPADPFAGVGIVGPQASDFDAATFASATLRQHFRNDATPKVILEAESEAEAPTPEQRKLFNADWQARYNKRTGTDGGIPGFLPSGFKANELSGSSNVDEIRGFMEYQRDLLLMANGVPRSILGDVVDANRAAADTNRLVFDRHTISPQAGLICDSLTHQLAVPEFGDATRVRFEEFVSADEDLRLKEERQDLALKVRSVNQVRHARGLDDVEWGELPIGSFGDQPYDGDEDPPPEMGPTDPAPDMGGDDPVDGGNDGVPPDDTETLPGRAFIYPRALSRVAANFAPDREWSRFIQAESIYVPRMVSAMRRVFAGQKALTLDALRKRPDDFRAWVAGSHSRATGLDELFDEADFSRLFDVLIEPIREDVFTASAETVLSGLEQAPILSFDEASIGRMREQGAQLVKFANPTTKAALAETLAKGIESGDTTLELEARVRKVYNAASKHRARTIARTEVGHAISSGQLAGYKQSKVIEQKQWNTTRDEAVRDSHRIDRVRVLLDSAFTLVDPKTGRIEMAEAPKIAVGGGRLSARNGINCRCFSTPVIEGG